MITKSPILFTVGFTKKNAATFFGLIKRAGVKRVLDIRLNNVSQLAGFAKRDDLNFFLKTICDCDYQHVTNLAPSKEILDAFKKNGGNWADYEKTFIPLLVSRKVERLFTAEELDHACLLCSEATPEQCHRRLVAEYLQAHLPNLKVQHL